MGFFPVPGRSGSPSFQLIKCPFFSFSMSLASSAGIFSLPPLYRVKFPPPPPLCFAAGPQIVLPLYPHAPLSFQSPPATWFALALFLSGSSIFSERFPPFLSCQDNCFLRECGARLFRVPSRPSSKDAFLFLYNAPPFLSGFYKPTVKLYSFLRPRKETSSTLLSLSGPHCPSNPPGNRFPPR